MRFILSLLLLLLSYTRRIYSSTNNDVPDDKYVNSCPAPTYYLWTSQSGTEKPPITKNVKSIEFQAYPNMKLMKKLAMIATYNFSSLDVRQCVYNCSMTVSCVSFNAFLNKAEDGEKLLTCAFFSTHDGSFLRKHGTTFYSRYAPHCPGYCEELYYLKVCAHCDCLSLCSSNITHYCDCTSQVKTPQKNCSNAVVIYGEFPLSALYYIDTARYTLKAMCQLYRYDEVETLWVTLYRRLSSTTDEFERSRDEYRSGFNKPYDDNYFIGYDKIAALTENCTKMTLGIVILNKYWRNLYIEFDGFKMVEVDTKNHVYDIEYDSMRCNDCIEPFVPKKGSTLCPQYDLLGNCDKTLQVGKWETEIKGVTFLLRPQQFNKPIELKRKEIRKLEKFGMNFQGKEENCIVINFFIQRQVKKLMLLRVFKRIYNDWHRVFEIDYNSTVNKFNLIRGRGLPILSWHSILQTGKKYKLQYSIRKSIYSAYPYDFRFGVNREATFSNKRNLYRMNGRLLIETGHVAYDPFILESAYLNGENIF